MTTRARAIRGFGVSKLWQKTPMPLGFDALGFASRAAAAFAVMEMAGLPRGARVLDVGVGTGIVASRIAKEMDVRITGVDISKQALAIARSRLPEAELLEGSATDIPVPSGYADVTLAMYVLRYVDEEDTALAAAELARVTKFSGKIIVADLDIPRLAPGNAVATGPDAWLLGVWAEPGAFQREMGSKSLLLSRKYRPPISFMQVYT